MTRIRTLDFLPSIFQTPTNSQFLGATLDQLVNPPVTKTIQGYVGSKLGYGIDAKDYYVTEPTKTRRDYQLEPGVVFLKENEETAKDFISYPGIIDSLKLQNGVTDNNNDLFNSQIYSFDPFCSLDTIINYNQYYWLPEGAPAVTVSASTIFTTNDYKIEYTPNGYNITTVGAGAGTINPTLTLLRGGTYNFIVDQDTEFWIQGEPGVTGYSPIQPNLYTREIYGVTNNGVDKGVTTFVVPQKDAQNDLNKPGNNLVDLVCNKRFEDVNGKLLSQLKNIDGVTELNNRTVLFFNGQNNETADLGAWDLQQYDQAQTLLSVPFDSNQYISTTSQNIYTVLYLTNFEDPNDPFVMLVPTSQIITNEKYTANYGTEYVGLSFYQNVNGFIERLPYISAPLDTLYYQDGTNPNNFGVIKLIENNETNTINVTNDILGQPTYTSSNGVKFTNGLKVRFDGDVVPASYLRGDYYVEGVGVSIQLIPTETLVTPEAFTTNASSPYDILPFDVGPYDAGLNIPTVPDYITIARNSISKNAWARSNRWFHIQVIEDTATYLNNPAILTTYATPDNKAKRPIIQFYPNLKLFNSGTVGKNNIDFIDFRTNDAFDFIEGQQNYYPDVQTYTQYTGSINANATTNVRDIISNQWYYIQTLGTTPNDTKVQTWVNLGAEQDEVGTFEIGIDYIITDLGTTTQEEWNTIAGTTGIVYTTGSTFTADVAGSGAGDGKALKRLFKSTDTGVFSSNTLVNGLSYTIQTLGTTQWNDLGYVGTPVVGGTFTANVPSIPPNGTIYSVGTGTVYQGQGTAKNKSITTITIDANKVNGTLSVGQWINDMILGESSRLPVGTRILDISGTTTLTITVYYPIPQDIIPYTYNPLVTNSGASFAANDTDNNDLSLFAGARIVFAAETNESIKNKIYVVNFNNTGAETYPVITLTEAEDGQILEGDQFPVQKGYEYEGKSFYFDGIDYIQAQQKNNVNQAPLFDIFDENDVSLGDQLIYPSSTFKGCKLFNYRTGAGINDSVLGFPISYSSINNVGDIRFDVSLYTDTFNYVTASGAKTANVNTGYVFNYSSRTEFERLIGWQTTVAESQQYQVFQFEYIANDIPKTLLTGEAIDFTVTCDIPQLSQSTTIWPSIQVFNNNNILTENVDYIVTNTDTSTIVNIKLYKDIDTPIQILLLSDKVSNNAYYTIPVNLANNPFNTNPESVDIGDIRGQYTSIFYNNPNTTGTMFGSNNYRDLGNMVPWGNRIIQNSASLVLPGAFLRNPATNLFDALLFNSREYIKFKTLLVDTINRIAYNQKYDPANLLDIALDEITSVKNQEQPFFWSDMIPNKAAFITNTYTFANDQDTSIFPLSKIYDFSSANYDGVLIYLQRKIQGVVVTKQLLTNIDYTISTDSPSVTVTQDLISGDKIIIKEYNKTYGSYVPNTPTKLGLYPAYIPKAFLDTSYITPTWFIQGHDGSLNKMYGEYNEVLGMPVDFRDQILLEYETRVYNNLKLSRVLPIIPQLVVPGYFRETPLSYEQFTNVYSNNFLDWIGQNRLDYKTQLYLPNDPWSYNYRGATFKLDNSFILQGNWRGIYEYVYDTATPNTTPWEMIGYANKPDWWETRYGPAPYTSNNLILWTDLQNGYDYGTGKYIQTFARPGLLEILPVDSAGELVQPLDSVIANFNSLTFRRSWRLGDDAPVEYSYRKSSTYPFDLMRLQALIKPALFYNLGSDLDNYKYSPEFNQFLVNDRTHLVPSQIQIYGNGIAKTSYINWIVDYQKQLGVDATDRIKTLLTNLDVRLVYRLAGFSDKSLLKFFVEKGSPNTPNPSLLIPDESYQVLLYNNQPSTRITYSGVVIQKVLDGYAIYGNNQQSAYFKTLRPQLNGNKITITVQDSTVSLAEDYYNDTIVVPYGTIFYSEQEVSQFLLSYGKYLENQGMQFESQVEGIVVNWVQMVQEYLYWAQSGWSTNSVVTLNPSADTLAINKESMVVQPLTFAGNNFILNNNLYPIQLKDLNIFRDGTEFVVKPLNEGDALAYGQFDLSNIEHGIVFNNVTLFNDVIYNLNSGLKQNRIYVRGTKSAEWNGTMFASGFIYNQDNITNWQPGVKYTKGAIVKYKNKFFTAITTVQPNKTFKELEWKETDYDEIQKGLLPNSSTRSYESSLYYNVDKANLESDADQLSFSLIGFRPREYMASADLTDITQVNVYKNLIKDKGTLNALKAFKGANLPQGGIDYNIYENWAIKTDEYGGILDNNFVEFKLSEKSLTANPTIIGLTNGNNVEGAQQLVPIYSVFNYGRPIDSPNILPLTEDKPSTSFPDAGYVNINDVKMSAYYYSNLPNAVDSTGRVVPINDMYVGDYIWLANYRASWQILTPSSVGQVIEVRANLNGTTTVRFKNNHNLKQYDIIAIINFDNLVNGYFVVTNIISAKELLINLTLPPSNRQLTGQGIALKFNSQRVAQPSDIQNLPLINNEFVKNKAWVDTNIDGSWAVYQKSINYQYDRNFTNEGVSGRFGASVAYTQLSDYLFGDPDKGKVYRYQYDALSKEYQLDQTLTGAISFGSVIAHEQNIYAISQPTGIPKIFLYTVNNTPVSDNIIPYQTITASTISPSITKFGDSIALSGDTNWMFVSDFNATRNNVHVYRKRNELITITNGVASPALQNDKTYQIKDVGTVNWTNLCDDTIAKQSGIYFIYNGAAVTGTGTAIRCDYEYITTLTSGSVVEDRFGYSISTDYYGTTVFVGAPNEDYTPSTPDIADWGRTYVYDRLVQNILMDTEYDPANNPSYALAWTPNLLQPITVTKNGFAVSSSDYTIVGNTFTYKGVYTIGDILNISGNQFVKTQVLETGQTPRIGVRFGTCVDCNTLGTELMVGAPFALSSTNQEGAGFRFTNGGARFGTITGTSNVATTATRQILLNGFLVDLPAGNATIVAKAINDANIINVKAQATGGLLTISLADPAIASMEQQLILTVTDLTTLSELGIQLYTETQTITCPHVAGPTQFGTVVKFNEQNSVAISAPTGTRFAQTTFDFSDDENLDNDTVFDNNSTQFIDTYPNMGAVYTYDYLGNYNESLSNIGAYTYAQSANAKDQFSGASPGYGKAIDWHDNKLVIGVPDYLPESIDGQVVVYVNDSGIPNWHVYRHTSEIVNIDNVQNIQLFSAETNNTLVNLDYIDPLQGKILGVVRQNIDIISNVDPANYNNATTQSGIVWGDAQVGSIWFDTSNIRYINYHQNDNSYNAKYWGTLFPGSDIAVYSWVASPVVPASYQGPGIPKDITNYTVQTALNSSNVITPVYYFWVRNSGIVFTERGKTLADLNLASYIASPQQSGVSYLAPLASDTVALYNCKPYINANDTVLHIGFGNTTEENPSHQEFTLIRQDYADDFLPGLPGTGDYLVPESLYDRMLDSLSGVDEQGEVVPNPLLPKAVQIGVMARPRQSFFYNRYLALKNYIQYANEIMALYPIVEIREDAIKGFLQKSGEFYDTKMYWERVNWWAPGYDNNTKSALQVPFYADLSTLDVPVGTVVTVTGSTNINLSGNNSIYVYEEGDVWTRIGLENGTIQFSNKLYDYAEAGYGFDGTFYDTDVYDLYPSEETRWIVRALTEQIYIDELLIHRNKSLILLFEYIQEETVENQNYLPWLNKTSLIDVSHKIRELKTIQNYLSDNQEFLSGYVNETKPYHVLVKEFLFEYTGGDVYPGTLTDFDLPSQYNTTIDNFVSPQLVYDTPTNEYQYSANAAIWGQQEYNEWFNNYGVSIGQYQNNNIIGQLNYPIATLKSYVTLLSDELIVDSVQGFPINGYIKLYDLNNPTVYEIIGYSYVNRATNVVGGLVRGQFGTQAANHIPGLTIYMDLPPVILLNGGKGYTNPPRVIATVPAGYPQPRVDAVLEAVMSGGSVTAITVVNSGSGYPVTPDIRIDPSITYDFTSTNVVTLNNTIEIYAPELQTGDLIRYVAGTKNVGGLTDDQWYYVNVLNSSPTTIMALYQTYADALQDNNRVELLDQGAGTQTLQLGAKAFAITNSAPVRENNITLRFDRTSYDTQVRDWEPNTFYGGEFVGYYTQASSSSLSLASVQPDIYNVLASAEGTVFPIQSVTNDRELTWSSGPEPDGRTVAIISNNYIGLSFVASPGDLNPSGSTIGFTVGMPVKFTGDVGPDIVEDEIYYVLEVANLEFFSIADQYGNLITLNDYVPSEKLRCFTATITDTAVITTTYPGIRTAIATSSTNNIVTIDLTDIGTSGTEGLYTKLPVYFTGNTFGGIEENKIYYVVSVLGNQNFTMSEQNDPVMVQILQTNLASQIICEAFTGLSVNEPVVFDSMVINGEPVDSFGNIDKQKIYYIKSIDNSVITISETLGGPVFDTGVVELNDNTFCFMTGQGSCVSLTTATGTATMSISMPLSPGQVNGQQFTFYPTSKEFADITSSAYGNLVEKDILKTLAYNTHDSNSIISGNQLVISPNNSYLYNNIPFSVSEDIGGLLRLKPSTSERQIYYATDIQNISVGVKSTTVSTLSFNGSAVNDLLTVSTIVSGAGSLYPGTQITGNSVEQNTYIVEQRYPLLPGETTGGVGRYTISRTYFVPATLTGVTASTGIIVLADDYFTDMIFENMPITFTGVNSFGGLLLNFRYYVRHILTGFADKRFTVSVVPGQSASVFTNATGSLTGTGPTAMQVYLPATELMNSKNYFIKSIGDTNFASIGATYLVNGSPVVAGNYYIINDVGAGSDIFWSTITGSTIEVEKDTIVYAKNSGVMTLLTGTAYRVDFTATGPGTGTGQAIVKLSNGNGPAVWQQRIVEPAKFDIGFVLGGYNVIINNGGVGFTQNNTITISGDLLGGTSPENDLTIQVSRINSIVPGTYSWSLPKTSNGIITKVICEGTPIGNSTKYFLKVDTANKFKVYSDQACTNPVSGINFPFNGYTTAQVTNVSGTNITVSDVTGFDINDKVIFTDVDNTAAISNGDALYIVYIAGNVIRVSDNPGGTAISIAPATTATIAKAGSFMLLPEPFYFNPSIVKYNNRVWECVVSNNDPTFVLGKWKLLGSGDPKLNALDRAKGYYAPTVNMPGYDLNQLFTGLTYPNTTYKGNEFEIDKQFALDTQLIDRPFDPSNLNMPAVAFDGTNYLAPANLPNYAGIVADLEVTDDWLLAKLADQTLSLTDLIRAGGKYLMTSTNSPTPIFKSDNYQIWSTTGFFVPINTPVADIEFKKKRLIAAGLSLNAITYHDNTYIAVGKNILTSTDTINWFERLILPTGSTFNDVSYVSTPDFNGYIAVGQTNIGTGIIYASQDGLNWNNVTPPNNRIFNGVASGFDHIFVVGNDKIILSSTDTETWNQVAFQSGKQLNDIIFANGLLVTVGDDGLVMVSNDGFTWNTKSTTTTEDLNSLIYVDIKNEWTIVGDNNTVIQANNINANPVIWDTTQLFSTPDPENIIVGSPFQYGYGPEEMVPGIVYDQLTMIVNTRAGTNWPATTYQHVGYNVVSVELDQNEDNVYSFDGYVQTPALISVFEKVSAYGYTSLYETTDYVTDYVNKTVTLTNPLSVGDKLRIDVYEIGNGDQLVKSNTQTNPIDINVETGFDEIQLNCNYAGINYTGGGIVNPGSETIAVEATETFSLDDTILCNDVSQFTLNQEITFAGNVFGGVYVGNPYYVKSINPVRSVITISETIVNGIAGPTLNLTTASGFMNVVIQKGPGSLFTEPGVFYNGKKLIAGYTNYVISSSSINNAFVTFSTSNLVTGQKIKFSDTIFGNIIPHQTYYIKQILSPTQFTICDSFGNVIPLTSATGSAIFVTGDYAVAVANNQISAKMILADHYDTREDYIAYSFFNQTDPQYGFTIPQTQVFNGDDTVGPYTLTNYLGGFNVQNAIVEVDGVRKTPGEYEINFATQQIEFNVAITSSQTIAVTTFNDTQRQYLFTNTFNNNAIVAPIQVINNIVGVGQPTTRITTTIPHGLINNDVIRIDGVVGSTQLNNQLFIVEKVDNYTVRIYEYIHGVPYSSSAPVIEISSYISGGYIWKYESFMLADMYATSSSTTTLTVAEVDGLVVDTPVYFTEDGVDIGYPLTSIPELIAGEEYFIKEINEFTNEFSISETQGGTVKILTADSGFNVRITQWEQTNVDRLWVTVNGYRVPSSSLRLNPGNEVSILTEIIPGDVVVITNMIPTATPSAQTYIQTVDQQGNGAVYRANSETQTWTVKPIGEFDNTIYVEDVTKITNISEQTSVTPIATAGYHNIGLNANKNDILLVRVYNNNPARLGYIDQDYITTHVSGLGPFVEITEGEWIEDGDVLTITVLLGKVIYINGEYMQINTVDLSLNLLEVQRGAFGSPVLTYIPVNSIVYSLLDDNKMTQINYNDTWNKIPGVYNVTQGDPLQIAEGSGPSFLRVDMS